MSDTQAKATPSKAAMELAEKIYRHAELTWFKQEQTQDETGAIIDLALRDLLEKAGDLLCVFGSPAPSHGCACNNCDFAKALEPWKPGE